MVQALFPTGLNSLLETSRLWTLVITQGSPFQLYLPQNPILSHNGFRTVWKVFCTKVVAEMLCATIKDTSNAEIVLLTEEQTAEQHQERMGLLGLLNGLDGDMSEVR